MVRDFRRTTLRRRHRPVVRAFAEALFSHEIAIPAARFDAFVDEVDGAISAPSKTLRLGLVLMLDAIRWLPVLLVGRWARFEDLSMSDRVRMLEAMEGSRFALVALLFVAWKTVMTMLYFEHPEELAAIGYPGEARKRWRRLPLMMATKEAAE